MTAGAAVLEEAARDFAAQMSPPGGSPLGVSPYWQRQARMR